MGCCCFCCGFGLVVLFFGLVWFLVLFGKSQKTNSFITISFCNTTFSSSYSMKLSKLFCYFKPWNWPGTKNKVEKMRKMQKKALISEHFSFFICCIFFKCFFFFCFFGSHTDMWAIGRRHVEMRETKRKGRERYQIRKL